MAKIMGVEIKKRKEFKGHEGEPCTQGDLYLDGRKIGYYSDSYTMGPVDLDLEKGERESFEEAVRKYFDKYPEEEAYYETEDIFLAHLNELMDREKEFKAAVKKGYAAIAIIKDGYQIRSYSIPESCLASFEKDHPEAKWYRSLDDFIIE